MLYSGYTVPPFYDSLLGKLVVWDRNRPAALARMRRALAEIVVDGLPTTIGLHRRLAEAPDVIAGQVHTRWLEDWLAACAAEEGRPI
jgi:acetyl-CoA carboxylase biotin carboxylase subunit